MKSSPSGPPPPGILEWQGEHSCKFSELCTMILPSASFPIWSIPTIFLCLSVWSKSESNIWRNTLGIHEHLIWQWCSYHVFWAAPSVKGRAVVLGCCSYLQGLRVLWSAASWMWPGQQGWQESTWSLQYLHFRWCHRWCVGMCSLEVCARYWENKNMFALRIERWL